MFLPIPKRLAAGLLTILPLLAAPLAAEQVTLNSLDGTVSMSGDLLEYDGTTYRLKMLVGEISINAAEVVCEGPGCPNPLADTIAFTIAGAGGVAKELMPTLIEVFALERGGDLEVGTNGDGSALYRVLDADGTVFAEITLQASNSAEGLTALLEGSAAVALATRPLSALERAAFDLAGKGRLDGPGQERIVALDAAVAVVNGQNPVEVLSLAQIRDIFDGTISNWRQLGGHDAPITLYRQDDSADTVQAFLAATGAAHFQGRAVLLESDAAVSDAVMADINGIGLTSFAQERNARALALRSVCGELFSPDEFALKSEEYPLTERIYIYTVKGAVPDVAAAFISFATSAGAQSVIRNQGFVDQSLAEASLDAQGRRLAQAIVASPGRRALLQLQELTAIMLDADRLSFTLHYTPEGDLDARARADITRLAALIRAGRFANRQMLALGFSDNSGSASAQLGTTQTMAQQVRDAIIRATGRANMGNLRISPVGYGQLMPLQCNDTPEGRRANNRVEIWVK